MASDVFGGMGFVVGLLGFVAALGVPGVLAEVPEDGRQRPEGGGGFWRLFTGGLDISLFAS